MFYFMLSKVVVGIDPGLVNAGFSKWRVFQNGSRQLLHAERVSFLQNKAGTLHYEYQQKFLPQLVSLAMKEREATFQGVDLVCIEIQMSSKSKHLIITHILSITINRILTICFFVLECVSGRMICVAQSLEHYFIGQGAVVVNVAPRKLKLFFGISMNDYRK